MAPKFTKIFGLINRWYEGETVEGIARPTQATIEDLINIACGHYDTTINSDVIKVLDFLDIRYKADGIGWRVI